MTDRVVSAENVYGVMRITLLGGQVMTVPKPVFRLHPLKPGESFSEEEYWRNAAKDEYAQGMQKAVRALTVRELSQKELKRSLARSGYRDETIARIIAYLAERRYVDDERYANQLAQARQRRHSARWITQTMQHKGIERGTIESAMAHVDGDAQQTLLDELARKYVRRHPDISAPQERHKAIASLVRRGFDFDRAHEALQKALEET